MTVEEILWGDFLEKWRAKLKDEPERRYWYLTPLYVTWQMKIELWRRRRRRAKLVTSLPKNGPYR